MYYGYYPYRGWPSPWGPPMGMGYPMEGPWPYPYWKYATDALLPTIRMVWNPQEWHPMGNPIIHHLEDLGAPGMAPFGPPMAPEQEISFLRDQAQMLKQQMDQIDARIKELEKDAKRANSYGIKTC